MRNELGGGENGQCCFKKRNVSVAKTTQNRPFATLLYILEIDLTGKRFNLICIFSKINLKKLVSFFSLSLAQKESKLFKRFFKNLSEVCL